MTSVKDKIIIVTGASSGIGLATAKLLLSHGANVYGVDISAAPLDISERKEIFKFHQCNLTEKDAASSVLEGCRKAFSGRVDALLNVAGIMDTLGSVDKLVDDEWDRVLAVNLTAPVKLMREVVNYWRSTGETKKSIVNVASRAGISGAVAGVAYTASKHGLVGATKNVAYRFKDEGIRCNAICPGAVATNIASSVQQEKMDGAAWMAMKPVMSAHMADGGTPPISAQQIAELLVFLVSDASEAINGAIIPIDFGWSTI